MWKLISNLLIFFEIAFTFVTRIQIQFTLKQYGLGVPTHVHLKIGGVCWLSHKHLTLA